MPDDISHLSNEFEGNMSCDGFNDNGHTHHVHEHSDHVHKRGDLTYRSNPPTKEEEMAHAITSLQKRVGDLRITVIILSIVTAIVVMGAAIYLVEMA